MNAAALTAALKEESLRLGFDLAGATPAVAPPDFDRFRQWLAEALRARCTTWPTGWTPIAIPADARRGKEHSHAGHELSHGRAGRTPAPDKQGYRGMPGAPTTTK